MVRKMREPKYHCQYCERPLDNLTTKNSHELACPQNPKNIKIEKKETPPDLQSNNLTDQIAIIPEPQAKRGKKPIPKKQTIPEELELEKDDQILRQLPTISNLVKDVEKLKVIPQAIQATQAQIAQLGDTVGKLNVLMAGIANRMSNPPQVEKVNQEKVSLSQGNTQADEILQAGLAADKEKIGQTPGEEGTDAGGKMEKLRKEAEEKKIAGSGQPGQVETGGVDPSLAAIADMPEGLQKIMLYATVAEKFLPLINSLRGGQQPQSAQTPDDYKMVERVYSNMTSVFSNALKLTQGFRQEARKEVLGELVNTYKLVPKQPGIEETKQEGLK